MSSNPEAVSPSPAAPAPWRRGLQKRFSAWLNRRIPPARSVTLDQRRIFIMPSRVGFFFGLCLLVMLLTAINYQNNLSYALTFLLATLFIIGILHTYANLAGITVHAMHARPAYPGQQSEFTLRLERPGIRERYALRVGWPDSTEVSVNLVQEDSEEVRLHCPVGARGWYNPGRLLIESTYPLGLLRCWTWVDLDLWALVYPRPLPTDAPPGVEGDQPEGHAVAIRGPDDFYGLRDYREGDSLRQVHWKGHAKGQPLQSKLYSAYASRSVWLDWEAFAGLPTEQRLSHLCYWALTLAARQEEFGLRLPGRELPPATGDGQRDAVLRALALHGLPERP